MGWLTLTEEAAGGLQASQRRGPRRDLAAARRGPQHERNLEPVGSCLRHGDDSAESAGGNRPSAPTATWSALRLSLAEREEISWGVKAAESAQ